MDGARQLLDVALYEAAVAVMESLLPNCSVRGVIRERTGAALSGIAPSTPIAPERGWT